MLKERYMVWPIKPGTEETTSELEDEWRGFATLERAETEAQKFSNRTGKSTSIEFQTYEVSRHGYEVIESDFGPWGTKPWYWTIGEADGPIHVATNGSPYPLCEDWSIGAGSRLLNPSLPAWSPGPELPHRPSPKVTCEKCRRKFPRCVAEIERCS